MVGLFLNDAPNTFDYNKKHLIPLQIDDEAQFASPINYGFLW